MRIKEWIKNNPYWFVGLLTILAYPFAVYTIRKQTPIITVMVGTPFSVIVLFGIWGWYADKKWGKNKRKFWTIVLTGDVLLILIVRLIGFKTILG